MLCFKILKVRIVQITFLSLYSKYVTRNIFNMKVKRDFNSKKTVQIFGIVKVGDPKKVGRSVALSKQNMDESYEGTKHLLTCWQAAVLGWVSTWKKTLPF